MFSGELLAAKTDVSALGIVRLQTKQVSEVYRGDFWRCLDFDIVIQINAPKNNSRINSSRPEREVYLLSCVQTDTGGTNDIFERSLSDHLVIF